MYSKNSNSTNGELVYPGIQSGGSRFLLMSLCPDQKSSECCDSDRSHWLVGIPRVSLDLLQRPNQITINITSEWRIHVKYLFLVHLFLTFCIKHRGDLIALILITLIKKLAYPDSVPFSQQIFLSSEIVRIKQRGCAILVKGCLWALQRNSGRTGPCKTTQASSLRCPSSCLSASSDQLQSSQRFVTIQEQMLNNTALFLWKM